MATAKKPEPSKIASTKDTTKKLETKAAVLVEPKVEAPKNEAAKAVAKPAAKKPAAKAEVKTDFFLQFDGKDYSEKDIIKLIKESWVKVHKNKVGDIKNIQVYLKPQENKAYYVINNKVNGGVDL